MAAVSVLRLEADAQRRSGSSRSSLAYEACHPTFKYDLKVPTNLLDCLNGQIHMRGTWSSRPAVVRDPL